MELGITEHVIQPMMPMPPRPLTSPPAWTGLLASAGAGIQEEVWLRLGFMTLLVWLGTPIFRRPSPSSGVIWTANVLAALLFGALHLPQAAILLGLTPAVVAFVLAGNGVPGIVFGWLYWRRGLVAAMIAHFFADLVLKVFMPILGLD